MRKDVKLGFTIGGILLAVVIAYVLVVPEREASDVHLVDADGNPIVVPTATPIMVDGSPVVETQADDAGSSSENAVVPPASPNDVAEPTAPTSVADANETVADVASAVGATAAEEAAASPPSDVDWEALLGGGEVLMTRTPATANETAAPLPPTEPETVVNASELTSNDVNPPVAERGGSSNLPTARPVSGGKRTHTVQSGETLSSISKAAYGSANYYPHIIRANPTLNPSKMKVGTPIVLPDISDVVPAAADDTAAASASVDATTQYRVQPGDSLYSISTKLYGSAARMSELYEVNKQTIGPDASKLKLNMVLKLPAPPTETASR